MSLFTLHHIQIVALLAAISVLFSVRVTAVENVDQKLQQVFANYHSRFLVLFPMEATGFGDNRFNDSLPIDISSDFAAKENSFYTETLSALRQIDRSQATEVNRLAATILEYELMRRIEVLAFDVDRIPFNQFEGLPLTFAQFGSGSSSQPFQSTKDYENWLARMEQYPQWLRMAVLRFREGLEDQYTLPRILVERMITQIQDPTILSERVEESIFYGPLLKFPRAMNTEDRERIASAYRTTISTKLIPAYQELRDFLEKEYLPHARTTSGINNLPNGAELYRYYVRRWTTTDLTPDEIYAIGEAEVARIEKEMVEVKQDMGFSGSLADFFVFLREDNRFKPFTTADEVIASFEAIKAKLAPQLDRAFTRKPKTPFEIRRTESFREMTASAEYMPGSADGSRPGIFYCPIPDPKKFNITSGMESLFLHEAIPGHHYQVSLQQENEALPEFARFLWYGAYGEGWALYCESIGEELGLYQVPEQKIGALGDEMHRAIRLVVDVGLHWKGWSREQAIAYMMSKEPISEQSAIAEVERYMAYPAQALSYKIGQLKIRELRKRCEAKLGSDFSLPAFHEVILRNGCMPLSILQQEVEAALLQ